MKPILVNFDFQMYMTHPDCLWVELEKVVDEFSAVCLAYAIAGSVDIFSTDRRVFLKVPTDLPIEQKRMIESVLQEKTKKWLLAFEFTNQAIPNRAKHLSFQPQIKVSCFQFSDDVGLIRLIGDYPFGSNGREEGLDIYFRSYAFVEGLGLKGLVWDLCQFNFQSGDELDLFPGRFGKTGAAIAFVADNLSNALEHNLAKEKVFLKESAALNAVLEML